MNVCECANARMRECTNAQKRKIPHKSKSRALGTPFLPHERRFVRVARASGWAMRGGRRERVGGMDGKI